MIKIKILYNFDDGAVLTNSWNRMSDDGNYHWKNIDFNPSIEDPDYYVIINYPKPTDKFDPSKTILFQMEPILARRNWPSPWDDPYWLNFFYVFDITHHRMIIEWHISTSYQDLFTTQIDKTKELSAIISNYKFYPGHILRVNFLNYLECAFPNYDLFSKNPHPDLKTYRGSLPDGRKNEGHFPYKYTFNAENSCEVNYFTEKITDAILSECLCFYWGCPNLEDFIDERAFIRIDITKPDEAIAVMKEAIKNNEWEKRIDIIRKEKLKILNELQVFPTIHRIIETRIKQSNYINQVFNKIYCINLDKSVDRWEQSQKEFTRIKLNVERFPAFDGKSLNIKDMIDQGIISNNCAEQDKLGAMGCLMSHVAIWNKIVKEQISWTLILEDDVSFHPHFLNLFENYWKSVPKDADMIFLGSLSPVHDKFDEKDSLLPFSEIINDKIVKEIKTLQGTHAYAISLKAAKYLLDNYLPIKIALDYFPTESMNIYAMRRVPGTPDSFYQDTHIWNGYMTYIHGIISVRPVPSIIDHRSRKFLQSAIDCKKQRDFKAAFTCLMNAYNANYDDPIMWNEFSIVCFYLGNFNQGLDAFIKLIEWTKFPKGKDYFINEKDRILSNIKYYQRKNIPKANEIAFQLQNLQL